MRSRGWLLGGLGLVTVAQACDGGHDALARRDGTGGKAPSLGGALGTGGFPSVASGAKSTGGSAGRPPEEPPGVTVLTFVHGVVDAERVLVCFVKGSGKDAQVVGTPEPDGGLGYAESFVASPIEGIDYATDALEPVVIAGDLELVRGLTCEAALNVARAEQALGEPAGSGARGGSGGSSVDGGGGAEDGAGRSGTGGESAGGAAGAGDGAASTKGGTSNAPPEAFAPLEAAAGMGGGGSGGTGALPQPPRLRVGDLPTIPPGSLSGGRSYLYVGTGCLGGPAFSNQLERRACGESYTPRLTTASAVLVAMSRKISYGKLGLQAVHASVATGPVEVTSAPNGTDAKPPRYIAAGVELGAIVPREPRLDFAVEDSGVNEASWRLEATQSSVRLFAEPWSDILRRAGVVEVSNLSTYALVLVGPSVDLRELGFWNPPAFALVATDPPTDSQ